VARHWFAGTLGWFGTLGSRRFAGCKSIATAIARHAQFEWFEVVLNARTNRRRADTRIRRDLPPFTVFAKSPMVAHDFPSVVNRQMTDSISDLRCNFHASRANRGERQG
jgi:hypothetical protein